MKHLQLKLSLYVLSLISFAGNVLIGQTCSAGSESAFITCLSSATTIEVTASYSINSVVDISGKTIAIDKNEDIIFNASATLNSSTSFTGSGNASITSTLTNPNLTASNAGGQGNVTVTELNTAIAAGETSLENALLSAAGVLPVELDYFRAVEKNGKIYVSWATQTEINNAYFEILHADNPKSLSSIHRKEGSGNSTLKKEYFFSHENPPSGDNFYMLKQVDENGEVNLSHMISAKSRSNRNLEIIHQLGDPYLTVRSANGIKDVKIYSASGNVVNSSPSFIENRDLNINIEDLPSGNYFIRIVDLNGSLETKQFVKI